MDFFNRPRWVQKLKEFTMSQESFTQRELQEACVAAGAQLLRDARDREVAELQGTISSVVLHPGDAAAAFTAVLDDGSEKASLVFLGRRAILGLEPGRKVRVKGLIQTKAGGKVLYNPRYEILGED